MKSGDEDGQEILTNQFSIQGDFHPEQDCQGKSRRNFFVNLSIHGKGRRKRSEDRQDPLQQRRLDDIMTELGSHTRN